MFAYSHSSETSDAHALHKVQKIRRRRLLPRHGDKNEDRCTHNMVLNGCGSRCSTLYLQARMCPWCLLLVLENKCENAMFQNEVAIGVSGHTTNVNVNVSYLSQY